MQAKFFTVIVWAQWHFFSANAAREGQRKGTFFGPGLCADSAVKPGIENTREEVNVYSSNLLPLFTLDSVLTHSVTFLFGMGREFPPDFTFIGDQLCQGAVSFKGHAKEPQTMCSRLMSKLFIWFVLSCINDLAC